MALRAIIFDIDDTLLATTACTTACRRRAVDRLLEAIESREREQALELERRLYAIFGWARLPDLWRALAMEMGRKPPSEDELLGIRKLFEIDFFETISVMPAVEHTLASLAERGFALGIISDGGESIQLRKLRTTGLDKHFPAGQVMISIQSDLFSSKPSTANFHRMEKVLDLRPEQIAYVGDKPWDITAANVAGWRSIRTTQASDGSPETWPSPSLAVEKPDRIIRTLSALLEMK